MGRPRKPVTDHLVNGTYRPSRHGPVGDPVRNEPGQVCEKPPAKPRSLTGPAGDVWDDLIAILGGIVRKRDVPALADLCRWVARMQRIAGTVDEMDPTDPAFVKTLTAAGIATTNFERYCSKFGLTPRDRVRLGVPDSDAGKAKVATRPRTKLDGEGQPGG